jgi:branched-chain amino acid transport system ATP-binding protein
MVPEGRHVFGSLTIEENLMLGAGMREDRARAGQDLAAVYDVFPMLRERKDRPAGVLSGGQQQMLVIGRALMTAPRLIAIDEPSLGLAPKVIDQVYDTLLHLRDTRGLTLVIVEQSSTRAMMTGGRMILLRSGEIVLEGDARQLARGDTLKKAYFGYGEH